jgi:pSer/pThr/pTyr-binding forkhead associated (FHA) protein
MWILETNDPAVEYLKFRLPAGSVKTLGRSTSAQFIVDVALVSRLHCQLTATDESLEVKDLDSTNGTFVNGRRVQTAQLHAGDTLAVGRCELVVSRG